MNGDTLKAIRIYFGLSQRTIAQRLGIAASYVCLMETHHKPVSDAVRIKIAQEFDVTDELLEAIRRSKLAGKLIV